MSDELFRINIWSRSWNKHPPRRNVLESLAHRDVYNPVVMPLECPLKLQVWGRKESWDFGRRYFVYWKTSPKASMSSERSHQVLSLDFLRPQRGSPVSTSLPLDKLKSIQALPRFNQKLTPWHPKLLKPTYKENISFWQKMSGPEELLKTLHKRKVGLEREGLTEWAHLTKVALQKRGWGRLAQLGETYYEHLVSDDNVVKSLIQHPHHFQPPWNNSKLYNVQL